MTHRVFNFSAGPAVLPEPVLARAGDEMLDWHGSGMSVMEMSHRGKEFMSIAAEAEADLRELLAIPQDYKVLFLQGGATRSSRSDSDEPACARKAKADYVDTGEWSKKAITEAGKYAPHHVAASRQVIELHGDPAAQRMEGQSPHAAYVHSLTNETIGGVEYQTVPDVGDVPLVADASSHILSRPLDVSQFGLIYAGAQKNIGPAGLTLVIVREDLLGKRAARLRPR